MIERSKRPPIERFFAKVQVTEGCWLWTGKLKAGYGRLSVVRSPSIIVQAHRFAFERFIGPIPVGLTLDHLCHSADETCAGGPSCPHRRCVNPLHLEPVTRSENVLRGQGVTARNRRKAFCAHGHPFDDANTIWKATGETGRMGRICRACRDRNNAWSNGKRNTTPVDLAVKTMGR